MRNRGDDTVSPWMRCGKKSGVWNKGVGPSTTLAWPGWKQPDIPVEVDTARLETSCRFILYQCTELSIREFPSLRGGGAVGSGGIVYDIVWMGCPRRTPWQCCVHLSASVFYRRLSPQFQFSPSAVTLVYLSQWVGNGERGTSKKREMATLFHHGWCYDFPHSLTIKPTTIFKVLTSANVNFFY